MKKFTVALSILLSSISLAKPQSNQESGLSHVTEDGDLAINQNSKNIYTIVGPITNGLDRGADLGPIAFSMKTALEKKEEVVLLINSPGGVVEDVTFDFLSTMDKFNKAGVPVTCVVHGVAASLAAIIYSKCTNRYSTPSSRILWHSVATGFSGKLNEQVAKKFYDEFHALNEKFWADTRKYFNEDYFLKYFNEETLIPAIELEKEGNGYLKIIRTIQVQE